MPSLLGSLSFGIGRLTNLKLISRVDSVDELNYFNLLDYDGQVDSADEL